MNDNEMFDRLRRFGDTVDQAAVVAGAPAGPLRDVSGQPRAPGYHTDDDADDLEPVGPVIALRPRRSRAFVAAAAALLIVFAGAVITARISGSPSDGVAASTEGVAIGSTTNPATTTQSKETTATTVAADVPVTSTLATSTSTSPTTTTRPTTPPVCPSYMFNNQYPIKLCNRGVAVELIQARLGVPVDGLFGPGTKQAVRDFQAASGLAVDGLVGQNTWAALALTAAGTDLDGDGVIDPEEMT